MLVKTVFVIGTVLASEQRSLAAGGGGKVVEIHDFEMEHSSEEGYQYHFANYGQDWGQVHGMSDDINKCGATEQSPINVMQPIGSYGWAYGLPNPREHDKFKSDYANIATDTLIKWDYSSLKFDITVEFEMEEEEKIYNMFFDSQYAKKLYDAKTSKFIPSHVVFKSPSEHTINGHHLDLEMQVYHKAKGWEEGDDIKYGVMAVFFSVEEFDKSIDEASNKTMQDFFRQLKFEDHEDKIAPSLLIGDVMNALEYEDRWTYKGSVSEPPCEQYVYWNLLRTVYPIEIDRFAFFSDFMYSKKKYLGGYKNNRKINTVEDHYVQYIGAHFISATKALTIVSATILAYVTLY